MRSLIKAVAERSLMTPSRIPELDRRERLGEAADEFLDKVGG
jgi:hypothetical protein